MSKIISLLILFCLFTFSPAAAFASDFRSIVTIVNPVRSRNLWQDPDSLIKYSKMIRDKNLPSTWLLQYALLGDKPSVSQLKNLPDNQEMGILLEVDQSLAEDSQVPYLFGNGDWARSDKVLLSGYKTAERERMIDTVFNKFKKIFGYYPSSVGAWYLDTLSLDYLEKNYKIKTVLDVSDQYMTDTYGVWGKPWGTPYYPSKYNSLIPAGSLKNKLDVVKIQWAQRDPVRGYGLTVNDSTYSVQANDYAGHHLNTDYFQFIAEDYLFGPNRINQLTVGLEVGQESSVYLEELDRQIDILKKNGVNKIEFMTMSDFSGQYRLTYPDLPGSYLINGNDYLLPSRQAIWYSTPAYRIGLLKEGNSLIVRDLRIYDDSYTYSDLYQQDGNKRLTRIIPGCLDQLLTLNPLSVSQNVKDIEINKKNGGIELNISLDNSDGKITLDLQSDQMIINNGKSRSYLMRSSPRSGFYNNIKDIIISYELYNDHQFHGGIRYSSINGAFIAGIMTDRNRLTGLSSKYPYLGVFSFPFQTLVRFKSPFPADWLNFLAGHFITNQNQCTIKL